MNDTFIEVSGKDYKRIIQYLNVFDIFSQESLKCSGLQHYRIGLKHTGNTGKLY